MTEISYRTPNVIGFKDRSGMLLVVGILFIIAGGLCGCLMGSAPMALRAPRPAGQPPPRAGDILVALMMYAMLCAAFLSLGIGCIRKRRWVRPLIIVFGWIGVTGGAIGMVLWAFALPQMPAAMRAAVPPGGPAPPAALFNVIVGVMTVVFAFIYVIIPATLLWLFRGADVQATLEHYDLQSRWTDAVPIPVLGLCALLAICGLWALMSATQGWFAAFGVIMTGAAARLLSLVVAAAFAAACLLSFRRRPAGWWMAMALFVLLPLAWITTLLRHDMSDIYRSMGRGEAEVRAIESMQFMSSGMIAISAAAFSLGVLAFAWRVRRYFGEQELPQVATAPGRAE